LVPAQDFQISLTFVEMFASAALVDFEEPDVQAGSGRAVMNPYLDEASGISFDVEQREVGRMGEVGLVLNGFTSVCVPTVPWDAQVLGTITEGHTAVGLSGYPIRARFPGSIPAGTRVGAYVQAVASVSVAVRLRDAEGTLLAADTVPMADGRAGTCGHPGTDRSRKYVEIVAPALAAFWTVEQTGSSVMVIDDFEVITPESGGD
ncbi:MAG: hypothetical protein KY453_10960, partial [Gemmatimonadetes bacterium]|nr:hypothetical protein [Gemmatimonadota bacterium]